MLIGIVVHGMQSRGDALLQIGARLAVRAQMRVELLTRLLDKSEKAGPLVGIVKIKGAVTQSRLTRDILRPGRVITTFHEQLSRRLLEFGQTFRLATAVVLAATAYAFQIDRLC